jgi:hypothetical protein
MKTYDHQTEAWRAPKVPDDERVIFSEPGRVLDLKSEGGNYDVCYRAFSYTVTVGKYDHPYTLRSRSGLGDRTQRIPKEAAKLLAVLDSDARFFLCHALREAYDDGAKAEGARVDLQYRQAFVDGRLKKRKLRGQDRAKVWIEPAQAVQS